MTQLDSRDYPLVIRGPLPDLGDVLSIARVEGRKALRVKKVRVKPLVYPHGHDYIVMIEPDGSGSSKSSAVGGQRKEER